MSCIDELNDCDAELSNITERVKEILETQNGQSALADAFAHIINDSQTILRIAIKNLKNKTPASEKGA